MIQKKKKKKRPDVRDDEEGLSLIKSWLVWWSRFLKFNSTPNCFLQKTKVTSASRKMNDIFD